MPRSRFADLARLALALGLLAASAGGASAAAFGRADADGSGGATFQEAKKALPKLKEVSFKRFDTDKNGEISRGEWSGLDAFYRSTYTSSGN